MPDTSDADHREARGYPDLPLILEQLQDQLEDLRQTLESQQRLIAVLTTRVATLERDHPS
jgi:hypothetical protein